MMVLCPDDVHWSTVGLGWLRCLLLLRSVVHDCKVKCLASLHGRGRVDRLPCATPVLHMAVPAAQPGPMLMCCCLAFCRASQDAGTITTICPGTCVQQVWHCSHAAGAPAAAAADGATTTMTGSGSSSSGGGAVVGGTETAAGVATSGHQQRSTAAVMPPLLSVSFPAASQQRLSTPFGGPSKAPFEWAPTAGPLEPASEMDGAAVDQATSSAAAVARSGVPTVMESKQHGGSSAFLALTAIDSIREESASEWGSSSHGTPSVSAWGSPGADGSSSMHGEASGNGIAARSSSGHAPAAADPAPAAAVPTQQRSGSGGGAIKTLFWTLKEGGSGSGGLYSNGSPHKPVEPVADGDHLPCALAVPAAAAPGDASSTVAAGSAPGAGKGSGSRRGEPSGDSLATAAGPSVRGGSKHVRFAVERAAGATASRDRSLIYTAPEILHGQR
jgi:hypothetical protein